MLAPQMPGPPDRKRMPHGGIVSGAGLPATGIGTILVIDWLLDREQPGAYFLISSRTVMPEGIIGRTCSW